MQLPLEQLRIRLQPSSLASASDAHLLEQFVERRESPAFTEMVRRHGPMVFGVCRRILRHYQDAEDAFQAVFLVLAQKAGAISPRGKLSSWLHGVACRIAVKARTMSRKRRERELAASQPLVNSQPVQVFPDWLEILDEEVRRLPEKYRLPILLCGMQDKTRREAAEILGCSEGTVAGRIFRAREMLARRLTKRGVSVSVAAVTSFLTARSASAGVSLALIASTVRFANLSQLGEAASGAVPGSIYFLSQGVLKTMALNKCKRLAALAILAVFCVGVGYFGPASASNQKSALSASGGQQQAGSPTSVPEPIDPMLVLQKTVQEELRLSKNQIQKLSHAWKTGDASVKDELQSYHELNKQIEILEKKISELRKKQSVFSQKIHEAKKTSLKQAIFENLSNQAVKRLQQITLRKMSLRNLLMDPKIQAKLNINDEQIKKLQELKSSFWVTDGELKMISGLVGGKELRLTTQDAPSYWYAAAASGIANDEVLKILTPEQRKTWEQMIGEPFPRPEVKSNK